MKMKKTNVDDLPLADSNIVSSFALPSEFGGFGGGASPYSSQLRYKDTGKRMLLTAKRQKAKQQTNFLCRRKNGHIRDRNFLKTICNNDDDDGGSG